MRDLRRADRINTVLEALRQLVADGCLSHEQLCTLKSILGWKRHIELICIRPSKDLPGSAFSGFFDRCLRSDYVAAGRAAAVSALDAHGLA